LFTEQQQVDRYERRAIRTLLRHAGAAGHSTALGVCVRHPGMRVFVCVCVCKILLLSQKFSHLRI
jgi:hypothetical protein